MKYLVIVVFIFCSPCIAQEVWNDTFITFAKPPGGDVFNEANQDRISPSVWLTRNTTRGLFNIRIEPEYTNQESPDDTRWAFSGLNGNPTNNFSAANYQNLNFTNWEDSLGGNNQLLTNILNRPGVIHLLVEDIYIDIEFSAWGSNGDGRFTYRRASSPEVSSTQVPIPLWIHVITFFLLTIIGVYLKKVNARPYGQK